MKRLLVVDDHIKIRELIRTVLERHDDMVVVGETGNGREVPSLVCRLLPDVVLLDMVMKPVDGLEVIKQIRSLSLSNHVFIIVVTLHVEKKLLEAAWNYGADGYMLKDKVTDEVVKAIETVCAGQRYISPGIPPLLTR